MSTFGETPLVSDGSEYGNDSGDHMQDVAQYEASASPVESVSTSIDTAEGAEFCQAIDKHGCSPLFAGEAERLLRSGNASRRAALLAEDVLKGAGYSLLALNLMKKNLPLDAECPADGVRDNWRPNTSLYLR